MDNDSIPPVSSVVAGKFRLIGGLRNGARVGDLFMSLIRTCKLNKVNPFEYLTELQKHTDEPSSDPEMWMPWNYQGMLQSSDAP